MRIPLIAKVLYSLFMALLIPVYWYHYGPSNFLYFCDVALILTLVGIWLESPLLLSMPLVGIFLPQLLWCLDFVAGLVGLKLTGMTAYMFKESNPLYLRGLSLFHGWLPWLLLWLVWRVGYDKRAFLYWSGLAILLILICYLFFPPPPAPVYNPKMPVNINYVYGMDDSAPQTWCPQVPYLFVISAILICCIYLPVQLVMKRWAPQATQPGKGKGFSWKGMFKV